ncbi:50S ribosomal protein L13 [Pasteuria penetrans]|uniref:50S ribosomal protein L13 n=1 Tax=Pasteuria penetrans TaxID=86005 RepID=UPI000F99EC52|nr:50S ribosomal protein L13 [Pasteuria penetrans]
MQTQKTYVDQWGKTERSWYVMDLAGRRLGRAASEIAAVLRGKHKPTFTPHVDGGDFVIVVNADKVQLTGDKWVKKIYHRHSGYPGGLKSIAAGKLRMSRPERMVEIAVRGMLPKTTLGRNQFKKMKVYAGSRHPHEAQQPKDWSVHGGEVTG